MAKRQTRRTVSLSASHYLLLRSLSATLHEPMTHILERLVEGEGTRCKRHPLTHEQAKAQLFAEVDARRVRCLPPGDS